MFNSPPALRILTPPRARPRLGIHRMTASSNRPRKIQAGFRQITCARRGTRSGSSLASFNPPVSWREFDAKPNRPDQALPFFSSSALSAASLAKGESGSGLRARVSPAHSRRDARRGGRRAARGRAACRNAACRSGASRSAACRAGRALLRARLPPGVAGRGGGRGVRPRRLRAGPSAAGARPAGGADRPHGRGADGSPDFDGRGRFRRRRFHALGGDSLGGGGLGRFGRFGLGDRGRGFGGDRRFRRGLFRNGLDGRGRLARGFRRRLGDGFLAGGFRLERLGRGGQRSAAR